jgi:hypothetical protein
MKKPLVLLSIFLFSQLAYAQGLNCETQDWDSNGVAAIKDKSQLDQQYATKKKCLQSSNAPSWQKNNALEWLEKTYKLLTQNLDERDKAVVALGRSTNGAKIISENEVLNFIDDYYSNATSSGQSVSTSVKTPSGEKTLVEDVPVSVLTSPWHRANSRHSTQIELGGINPEFTNYWRFNFPCFGDANIGLDWVVRAMRFAIEGKGSINLPESARRCDLPKLDNFLEAVIARTKQVSANLNAKNKAIIKESNEYAEKVNQQKIERCKNGFQIKSELLSAYVHLGGSDRMNVCDFLTTFSGTFNVKLTQYPDKNGSPAEMTFKTISDLAIISLIRKDHVTGGIFLIPTRIKVNNLFNQQILTENDLIQAYRANFIPFVQSRVNAQK